MGTSRGWSENRHVAGLGGHAQGTRRAPEERRRHPSPEPSLDLGTESGFLMSSVALTSYQLRSKVASVLQRDPEAQVIGLHATGEWRGDVELDLGERRFAVVRADTVLEVREALAD